MGYSCASEIYRMVWIESRSKILVCDSQLFENVQDVINAVEYAWGVFNHWQLERAFLTLQTVFEEVIKCQGGSCYKIPHIGKKALLREHGIFVLRERAERASQEAVDLVEQMFG